MENFTLQDTAKITKRVGVIPYPSQVGYFLSQGEVSELVSFVQLMLNALTLYYDFSRIPVSGEYDTFTSEAVKLFQKLNQLEISGNIDSLTWDRLALEYNQTVNDNQ